MIGFHVATTELSFLGASRFYKYFAPTELRPKWSKPGDLRIMNLSCNAH